MIVLIHLSTGSLCQNGKLRFMHLLTLLFVSMMEHHVCLLSLKIRSSVHSISNLIGKFQIDCQIHHEFIIFIDAVNLDCACRFRERFS